MKPLFSYNYFSYGFLATLMHAVRWNNRSPRMQAISNKGDAYDLVNFAGIGGDALSSSFEFLTL